MPHTSTAPRTVMRAVVALLGTTCLLVTSYACTSESSAPPKPLDACELMTRADVKAVYGIDAEEVEIPEAGEDPQGGKCAYDTGPGGQLRLLVERLPNVDSAEAQFDDFRSQFQEYEEVDGLGDEALWVAMTAQLMVRSGDTYFVITSPLDTSEETAEKMATRVLAALDEES